MSDPCDLPTITDFKPPVSNGIQTAAHKQETAIAYLAEVTGFDMPKVASEVDRYISDPGQALGYMIGQLKISGLMAILFT